jgi:hypothetical protein
VNVVLSLVIVVIGSGEGRCGIDSHRRRCRGPPPSPWSLLRVVVYEIGP